MKPVYGVMGSSRSDSEEALRKAQELGRSIARLGAVIMTGATTGYSLAAAKGAAEAGGLVLGVSPALDRAEHSRLGGPLEPFDVILYSGFGNKGRNVLNIRGCDVVLFVSGSMGTLNEFTIAYDEGKVMGVLTGTGGFSDHYAEIIARADRQTGARVLYDADPARLVERTWELACPAPDPNRRG
ncbi:MAG: LOG family protein [Candidatus Wallbacteria bacterium]|nr:LOG family protein [Candidatus Wallbacteria bacterium]